jgi:hypothetical protein
MAGTGTGARRDHRQAAERRYLRSVPATSEQRGGIRDYRVQAERDRWAGQGAVENWANDNTADLRRLAGQVIALADLGDGAVADVGRLHRALADADALLCPGCSPARSAIWRTTRSWPDRSTQSATPSTACADSVANAKNADSAREQRV